MRHFIYPIIAFTLFLITGCSSPLSDTPISDPGLITPNIILKHVDGDFGISNHVTTRLTDKNGAYIELMEGEAKVNNEKMEFHMTCYQRDMDIKPEAEYTFSIILSDSAEYPFTVTTPAFFKKVKYPSKVKKNTGFEISWNSEGSYETQVIFSIRDTTNSLETVFEEYTYENHVFVDPDNFTQGDIEEGMITLYRTSKGKMPDGFNGGNIDAICIFERTVKIK